MVDREWMDGRKAVEWWLVKVVAQSRAGGVCVEELRRNKCARLSSSKQVTLARSALWDRLGSWPALANRSCVSGVLMQTVDPEYERQSDSEEFKSWRKK